MKEQMNPDAEMMPDNETAEAIPGDEPAEGEGKVFEGMNVDEDKVGELSQKALTFVYGNSEVFANLIGLLKAQKGTNGIKEATIGIMDRMVSEGLEASQEELMSVGVIVMTHVFDVAQRIGVVKDVNEQVLTQTAQEAVQMWMQRNGQNEQPQQPQPQQGLLDAGGVQ